MKNYELISLLMELPSGYNVEVVQTQDVKDLGEINDMVSLSGDSLDSVDYPIYAKKVAHAILDGECEKGILICGTGIGISITANKFKGIRAAVCTDCFTAEATRLHNDANILALGGRVVGPGLALKIVDTFLNTPFSNDERHIRRINQIETE